jgi:hypothetical protein
VGSHACYSVCAIKLPEGGKTEAYQHSVLARGVADSWLVVLEFPLFFFCLFLLFPFFVLLVCASFLVK